MGADVRLYVCEMEAEGDRLCKILREGNPARRACRKYATTSVVGKTLKLLLVNFYKFGVEAEKYTQMYFRDRRVYVTCCTAAYAYTSLYVYPFTR